MHQNFIHDLAVLPVAPAAAAGQSVVTTSVIDMRGFESVCFVATFADVSDGSVLTMTGQMGDQSDGSDAADLVATATFTADATSADNKIMMLDLHMPAQRYVRATLARDTADAAVANIIAVLYNASERPIQQAADVVAATLTNDPQLA